MSTPRRDIEHAISLLAQARSNVPSWRKSKLRLDIIINDLHKTLSGLDADMESEERIRAASIRGQEAAS